MAGALRALQLAARFVGQVRQSWQNRRIVERLRAGDVPERQRLLAAFRQGRRVCCTPEAKIVIASAGSGGFALGCRARGCQRIYCFAPVAEDFARLQQRFAGLSGCKLAAQALFRSDLAPLPEHLWHSGPMQRGNSGNLLFGGRRFDVSRQMFLDDAGRSVPLSRPLRRSARAQRVTVTPLDDVLRHHGAVRLLRLDLQGGEFPVLLTSRELRRVEQIEGQLNELGVAACAQLVPEARLPWSSWTAALFVEQLELRGFRVVLRPQAMHRWSFSARRIGAGTREPPLVPSDHYGRRYDSKLRFGSYWHQIHEILRWQPASVLEVGIGNGFVSDYLRKRDVRLRTVDVNPELGPDLVASVLALPFADASFDVACSFETLEHIDYGHFPQAVAELARVARRAVLLSLPDVTRRLGVLLTLPGWRFQKGIDLTLPGRLHTFDGQHFWEIGKRGYPLSRILAVLRQQGLRISRCYRADENLYHRFIVAEIPPRS